ncbi:MAG: riboflavin kinase [Candidatus Peregrinibacteria bacterium]
MMPSALPSFTARVVKGAGRGRTMGSPTLNLALGNLPRALKDGIYACRVSWNRQHFSAAMHVGPRPVFKADRACELHVIDRAIRRAPVRVTVEVIQRLRSIRNFPTVEKLQGQIVKDIAQTKQIMTKKEGRKRNNPSHT